MAIEQIKCPSCGAALSVPEGVTSLTCDYCGCGLRLSTPAPRGPVPEADGTIRDQASGQGLFIAPWPQGWQFSSAALQRANDTSRPYRPQVGLHDSVGSMSLTAGVAGVRRSKAYEAMMAMYGNHLIGIDRTNYADMPDPVALCEATAQKGIRAVGGSGAQFVQQYALSGLQSRQQEALAFYQQGADVPLEDPFISEVLRLYRFEMEASPWYACTFVRLSAVKQQLPFIESGGLPGMGNLMESLGSLGSSISEGLGSLFGNSGGSLVGDAKAALQSNAQFEDEEQYRSLGGFLMGGGLVGRMRRQHAAQQAASQRQTMQQAQQPMFQQTQQQMFQPAAQHLQQPAQQPAPQTIPPQAGGQPAVAPNVAPPPWCTHDQAQYCSSGTIAWGVDLIATMIYPAQGFEEQFNRAFLPLMQTVRIHPDIMRLTMDLVHQQDMAVQQATQTALTQQNAQFQAMQAANRQVQAAYDSANAAWWERSEAHHAAFRQQTNAQFSTAIGGEAPPDYSEAIRGVNTYVASDGREVEISVQADRAWENQAGDVIGTSGGIEPGAGWVEIPKQ